MIAVQIFVGFILLISGRKVFWFALGVAGFLVGMRVAEVFIAPHPEITRIVIALAAGVLFSILTLLLQKVAVAAAGFVAGGYGAFVVMRDLHANFGEHNWIPVLIAGVIGMVFAAYLFEWALIVVSSVLGSYLLVSSFTMSSNTEHFLFILLSLFGIVVQAKSRKKSKPEKQKRHQETQEEEQAER